MGYNNNDYKLILENFKASMTAKEAREVFFERNITVTKEELLLQQKLNHET